MILPAFGVVSEMLGMAPGDLEVISGGVNHFNWLMDIRKRGTGESCIDEFYDRVREDVRFIQGVPAEVCPGETEGSLRVYSVAPGADRTEAFEFDRVVLAIGLVPTDSHRSLADVMGLDLNEFGYFARTGLDAPREASRPGVYLAGACGGPADIQGSRKQAMAVASQLALRLREHSKYQARGQVLV